MGRVNDQAQMGRQKALVLEEDFLDSDKALCGLPLARFGLTLPSPRPPCCCGGRQRGTQGKASALGMLGETRAGGSEGTDPCSGCSPQ